MLFYFTTKGKTNCTEITNGFLRCLLRKNIFPFQIVDPKNLEKIFLSVGRFYFLYCRACKPINKLVSS